MDNETLLEAALKRDRTIVAVGLVIVAALAWSYTAYLAWGVEGLSGGIEMAMPQMQPWGPWDFVLMSVMWAVMMVAMMTPSAAPMVLVFTMVHRRRRGRARPYVPAGVFLLGYLAVWTAFSAVATVGQWALHSAALLSSVMGYVGPLLGGAILIAAGLYQWSPLKHVCLKHCRSPLSFIMTNWREGILGAFRMGVHHGGYCVGCCWLLMGLLFVAGVMNLLWIAAIAVFVLLEKALPWGDVAGRTGGGLLALAGAALIAGSA